MPAATPPCAQGAEKGGGMNDIFTLSLLLAAFWALVLVWSGSPKKGAS